MEKEVKQRSRTANVTINMVAGLVCQIINVLVSFISRTYFIRLMGVEYLGVNGLFTNILTILSFAELGIGNAIVFSMYKPLATRDEEKLSALIRLFKKAYTIIGTVVLIAGLCVLPFLDFLVKDVPNIKERISLIYVLFLANTAASYFVTYKKSIITADQKNYIILAITETVHVLQIVAQLLILYFTRNFILYLVIQICATLLTNVVATIIANRMYPFIKKGKGKCSKEETQKIFKDVKALAIYKFGSVILNGTDSVLVSLLSGVTNVGLVSNYVLLSTSCSALLGRAIEGFTASVGNMNTDASPEKKEEIFNKIFFISAWLYGFVAVGLAVVSRSFISAWIGSDYLLGTLTCIAIVSEFYVKGVHFAAYTYRTTMGYFVEGRVSPIIAAVLNIVLSILLFKWIGLCGIFFATPIARILTTGLVDPVLVYKKGFGKSPKQYYFMYAGYLALFVAIGLLCSLLISWLPLVGWLSVLVEIVIVSVLFNGILLLLFGRTKMFKDLLIMAKSVFQRKRKN